MNATETERPPTHRAAVRLLWDEATRRPCNGLSRAEVDELLRAMDPEDRAEAVWLALDRGELLEVRRTHGQLQAHKDETRYFALGGRP